MDKPTVQEILEKSEQAISRLSALRNEQAMDDSYYENTFSAGIQDPFWEVKPSTGRSIIDNAVDHTVTSNPLVKVPPRKEGGKFEAEADTMEAFYQGCIDRFLLENPDPIREAALNIYLRGEFFFKVTHNPRVWPKKQIDMGDLEDIPIMLMSPDPQTIYPSAFESQGKPLYVFEMYSRTVEEISQIYPEWTPKAEHRDNDLVDWIEWWHPQWRCFLADGIPVLKGEVQPNIYGFTPYVHQYSGLGKKAADGKPERLAVGLIKHARQMLQAEVRNLSHIDSVIGHWAQPMVSMQDTGDTNEIEIAPGVVITYPPNSNFQIHQAMSPPSAVFDYAGYISNLIQKGTTVGVLRGEAAQGVDVGYLYALMVGQARLRFGQPLKNLKSGLETALSMCAYLVEHIIKEPVSIKTVKETRGKLRLSETTIQPDIFNNYYKNIVKLEPMDPQLNDQRTLLGFRLWQGGAISWRTFLEDYAGYSNASEEMGQALADLALKQPEMLAAVVQAAVQKFGMQQVLDISRRQASPPGGAASTPGVPEGPQVRDMNNVADLYMRRQERLGAPAAATPMETMQTRPQP